MGKPFSASQIKAYVECPRKWGWKYLEHLQEPASPSAELGVLVHSVLESWLRKGEPPDPQTREGKIALAGLAHLPSPSPHLHVEREIRFNRNGNEYIGYVDLGFATEDEPWVVDHKTTGDFMWALTQEDLRHDVQAILYAYEALERYSADAVQLMWVYYRTRGAAASMPVRAKLGRAEVESGFQVIEEHYVSAMAAHKVEHANKRLSVLQLDSNAFACSNYGGCPFVGQCKMTTTERRRSIMAQENKKMTLKERMRARKELKETEDGGADEVAVSTNPRPVADQIGKPAASTKPVSTPAQAAKTEAPQANIKERMAARRSSTPAARAPAATSAPAINPPEQPETEVATQPLSDTEAAEGGRGRGRPKGSANKKDNAADPAGTQADHFVAIYCAALRGGEPRHLELADLAWDRYKAAFGK